MPGEGASSPRECGVAVPFVAVGRHQGPGSSLVDQAAQRLLVIGWTKRYEMVPMDTVETVPRVGDHLQRNRQMAFVSGPRQVGKTTCRQPVTSISTGTMPIQADDPADGRWLSRRRRPTSCSPPVLILDELHKHAEALLKGFFDTYGDRVRILVTGSSRLDIYRRGGDSLMGRYLLYRMHPWSVGELLRPHVPDRIVQPPEPIDEEEWQALCDHGGFPEPFLRRDLRFSRRWRSLRQDQLSREDLRDVAHVQDLGAMETLMASLAERSSHQLVYAALANEINVSVDTVKRWIDILGRLHYGFTIRPWFKNVTKALRKEPRWFLRDWSGVADPGDRAETMVGCHLLKAVEGWTDLGFGDFELRYLRDKAKREVDFVVVRDRQPWFLVEVKRSDTTLSPALAHFQAQTRAAHAFQVVMELPFQPVDAFAQARPCVVPAKTLLSQLL